MGQLVEQVKGILNEATFAIHVYEIVGKGSALIYASFDEIAMEFLAYRWSLMSGTGLQLVDKVRVAHSSPLLTQFDVEVRETLYIPRDEGLEILSTSQIWLSSYKNPVHRMKK